MTHLPQLQHDFSLRQLNSFGVDAKARAYVQIVTANMLSAIKKMPTDTPRLVLGGGSNILLTGDFPGLVLHMCNKGIGIVSQDDIATHVCVAAGESWHQFVLWTLAHGLAGLENLSLIPGSVGAAPIQNIGAYGVEVKDYVQSLRAFDFETGETMTLGRSDCAFGYRDSLFKHALRDRVVILDVTFALPRRWQPNISYVDVAHELAVRQCIAPTARDISDAVIAIRTRKLPDPAVIGNAGSFFKNPVVPASQHDALLATSPNLVSYLQPDGGYKLAAGWLIDQCGWKGRSLGPVGVYEKQALVLVNRGGASGREIAEFANLIQADVKARFGVMLEPEPVYV